MSRLTPLLFSSPSPVPRPFSSRWFLRSALAFFLLVLLAPVAYAEDPSTSSAFSQLRLVKPEAWTILSTRVKNPTPQDLNLLVGTTFASKDQIQFATPVWVPAKSLLRTSFPARVLDASSGAVRTETLLLDPAASPEHQLGPRQEGALNLLPSFPPPTAVLTDPDPAFDPGDFLAAVARAQSRKSITIYLTPDLIPSLSLGYQAVDHIVLAAVHPNLDPAQLLALRQWIYAGGKLWVLADRLDPNFLPLLLGSDSGTQLVDRVELADFRLVRPGVAADELHHAEPAVAMNRFLAPRMEILASVNGWPVALRQPVGLGSIFLTTLQPVGFLKDKNSAGDVIKQLADEFYNTTSSDASFVPHLTLQNLVSSASSASEGSIVPREETLAPAAANFLLQQIGYKILPLTPVLLTLAAFLLAILAAGLLFGRSRLEYIAPTAVLIALAASAVLYFLGAAQRSGTPFTVATVQIAQLVPTQPTPSIVSAGLAEIYTPANTSGPLLSSNGAILWPDLAAQAGNLVRFVTTDYNRFQWQKLNLRSAAMLAAETANVLPFLNPPTLVGSFTPEGFHATLSPGAFPDLADPLLVAPQGAFALPSTPDGSFLLTDANQLPDKQYLSGALLSPLQRQHQAVYLRLLENRRLLQPTVFLWTQAHRSGLSLDPKPTHAESLLLALPLTIQPSSPGSRVTIPAAFLPFTPFRSGIGAGSDVSIYNASTGQWNRSTHSATIFVRFPFPSAVLPFRPETQRIRLAIDAPRRVVQLLAPDPANPTRAITLLSYTGPTRTRPLTLTLDGPTLIPLNSDGSLTLGLSISAAADDPVWDIDSLTLSLTGVAAP